MLTDPLFGVAGQVIVVTGAMGQLGGRFARMLAERGARVVVLDVIAAGEETENLMFVSADVTSADSLRSALVRIGDRWEAPFGLVNNAAIDSPPDAPSAENGPFESYPEESWDR